MRRLTLNNLGSTLIILAAIVIGALIGGVSPNTGERLSLAVDPLILALVSLLFFEVRFRDFTKAAGHLRFVAVAWAANFLIIPAIGYGIAWLLLRQQPPLFLGLMIYFMAPCTDWFLGFTRLARGNTSLGTALLPINLVSQLLLYPLFISLFAGTAADVESGTLSNTLMQWFLVPFVVSSLLHILLEKILPNQWFGSILTWTGRIVPIIIALLVLCIFSANITVIFEHYTMFGIILGGVFIFFILTYFIGEALSRTFGFAYPEHALLTMTTAARNAPLMFAVTAAAFPEQPLVYAALVIGMLVEFPHLTILKYLLLRNAEKDIQRRNESSKRNGFTKECDNSPVAHLNNKLDREYGISTGP